jgi:hypothetical protein
MDQVEWLMIDCGVVIHWCWHCRLRVTVAVDDTNYQADASWQTYTGTNLTVNL